jgi:hypothetical protein
MEQYNDKKDPQQEVDLVPVFVWISNGFKNLFRAIVSFFKAIGHGIMLFLAFIQANLILLAVFVAVGLALGFYVDSSSSEIYSTRLRVAPNFESSSQLISNVNYYNSLQQEEDHERLAQELDITVEQAQSITSFEIEPSYNDTELLREYDALARESDTMALENFTFEGFKEAKREMDYKYYAITVTSKDRGTLEDILQPVVTVQDNAGIKAARSSTRENIAFDIRTLNYQLEEVDSLIAGYQKAIATGQTSNSSSTNLFLGDQRPSEALRNLFAEKRMILDELNDLREQKYRSDETVNIVSQFITRGRIESNHTKLKILLVFLGLGLLVAVLPLVWRGVKEYPTRGR